MVSQVPHHVVQSPEPYPGSWDRRGGEGERCLTGPSGEAYLRHGEGPAPREAQAKTRFRPNEGGPAARDSGNCPGLRQMEPAVIPALSPEAQAEVDARQLESLIASGWVKAEKFRSACSSLRMR